METFSLDLATFGASAAFTEKELETLFVWILLKSYRTPAGLFNVTHPRLKIN